VLRNYGNMSSPTILFVLNSFLQSEASGPCVAIGFGPGIYAEAALLEFE
jgi:predicted naringenin-chalcone synthase